MPPLARTLVRLALLAPAFALATWAFGWWTVPVLAAAWGAARARGTRRPVESAIDRGPAEAAAAALVAWGALLAAAAARGPVGALAGGLAELIGAPAAALVVLTLVFPALLAWSAAAAARGLTLTLVGGSRST
jgi:hypothetical protein